MRLIDADKLIELLRDECAEVDDGNRDIDESTCLMTFRAMHEFVNNIPTVDVVEVVRCKDCKHFNPRQPCADGTYPACTFLGVGDGYGLKVTLEFFCSCGERRENGEIH